MSNKTRVSRAETRRVVHQRQTYSLWVRIKADMAERYASYERDCEADHARGYRAHYCEHGTNQWTDYDNICGPCEDGYSFRYAEIRQRLALDEARSRLADVRALDAAVSLAERHKISIDWREHVRARAALLLIDVPEDFCQ